MKIGLIYQPCGLGDILFLQKIAHAMKNEGYEVYWPVIYEYEFLNNYIPDFHFVSWSDKNNHLTRPPLPDSVEFPHKDLYLPETKSFKNEDVWFFQGFVNVNPIMCGKYETIGMEWKDWRNWLKFEINEDKQNELFYDVLKLTDDDDYVFINNQYGSRPKPHIYGRIDTNHNKKVVTHQIIDGFSPFEWLKVMQRASEIHMIETSYNYLMEAPSMIDSFRNKKLVLYHRSGNYHHVKYLHSLPWEYR